MLLRAAVSSDRGLLELLLVEAFNWPGQARVTLDQVRTDPAYAHHLRGWPRARDVGVVAESEPGEPLGAAWARVVPAAEAGYGFVAEDVPELGVAVLAPFRGRGVGGSLVDACIAALRDAGHAAVSLSVEDGNDVARRLYEARGFRGTGQASRPDLLVLEL